MEKRAIAAIALSVLVLFGFRYLEERRVKETGRNRPPLQKQTVLPPEVNPVPPAPITQPAESPILNVAEQATDTHSAERRITIECGLYRAVIDNRGAVLTSWNLNNYRSGKLAEFEMIAASHFPETRPYPGALVLDDAALMNAVNGDFYEVEVTGEKGSGDKLSPPVSLSYRLRRGDLQIVKTYRFGGDNYLVDLSVSMERDGRPVSGKILVGQDIGPEYEHLLNPSLQLQAVYNIEGKVKREGAPKEENQVRRVDGAVRWVGLDMHYFAVIAIPNQLLPDFEIVKRSVKTLGLDQKEIQRDLLRVTVPTTGVSQLQLYIGPKKQSYLDSVRGGELSGVIDFGMFSIIVRPLLVALVWIHQYVHNWGFSIILLTLALTILLFPFRLKQMMSMKKMQVVQPKVKEIQEKYKRYKKTDPKRAEMNQEIMALYKEHNVNPLGGCLPLILQMPLLFAFYQLLASSIELRQAPFFGWIQDLAQKDPYYILPIIMGVTMLISQKMTPMAPGSDPTQAKMMMIMPVVFTVMFFNVSSGLNLYFLCSNIFQIVFQKVAERWVGDKRAGSKSRD